MGLVLVLVAGATLLPGAVLVVLGARVGRGPASAGRRGRTAAAALGGTALVALGAALVLVGLAAAAQLVIRLP